jgi:hypothetical protein
MNSNMILLIKDDYVRKILLKNIYTIDFHENQQLLYTSFLS